MSNEVSLYAKCYNCAYISLDKSFLLKKLIFSNFSKKCTL